MSPQGKTNKIQLNHMFRREQEHRFMGVQRYHSYHLERDPELQGLSEY